MAEVQAGWGSGCCGTVAPGLAGGPQPESEGLARGLARAFSCPGVSSRKER